MAKISGFLSVSKTVFLIRFLRTETRLISSKHVGKSCVSAFPTSEGVELPFGKYLLRSPHGFIFRGACPSISTRIYYIPLIITGSA
jgi:hypothetical protein